ncbi:MAG: NAD(+) diphosphatase [Bifidobacterium tsurumiense]|uniref:NAD(+) diphosphatase n=1 Tax=Bifidobacterium tsurumiense TaxID=356829 RepID=UPI002A84105D|nr:NAD(+) diphosphatase [Bifidobacterium tsurumiense]MDY4678730.1 NAD(+) diphosphatase [Bifidobacterium tsurumiense]
MGLFSPLAMTQALPFLPLAQGDIDYQVSKRAQPGLIEEVLQDPNTKVMLVSDGLIAIPKDPAGLRQHSGAPMRLATIPGNYAVHDVLNHREVLPIFLGSYGPESNEYAVAVDISRISVDPRGNTRGVLPDAANTGADAALDESMPANKASLSIFAHAKQQYDWVDLRTFAPHASARQVGQATTAIALSNWHTAQRYCPTCGSRVESALSGWAQRCTNESDGNRLLFPRVEPAVIVAIVDGEDRLLMQHNRAWNDASLFSVTAGFVEAGENLEHTCRREAMEETGIRLGEVKYLGSQPWPFPASLMMAFKAQALSTEIHADGDETTDVRWMSREQLTHALIAGEMSLPGKASIARHMIQEWYGQEI